MMMGLALLASLAAQAQERLDVGRITRDDNELEELRGSVEATLTNAGVRTGEPASRGLVMNVEGLWRTEEEVTAEVRFRVMQSTGAVVFDQVVEGSASGDVRLGGERAVLDALGEVIELSTFQEALGGAFQVSRTPYSTGIRVKSCAEAGWSMPNDSLSVFDAVLVLKTENSLGSGVVISPDGWAFTAAHVVEGLDQIEATTWDERTVTAEVVRVDRAHDAALLRLPGASWPCVGLSRLPPPGTDIYAIGSPMHEDLSFTVSKGVVSAYRQVRQYKFVQTDASVNPGNSGGPLLDQEADLVGVVSFKMVSDGFSGLAFGVPADAMVGRLGLTFGTTSTTAVTGGVQPIVMPELASAQGLWTRHRDSYAPSELPMLRAKRVRRSGVGVALASAAVGLVTWQVQENATDPDFDYRPWQQTNIYSFAGVGLGTLVAIGGHRMVQNERAYGGR